MAKTLPYTCAEDHFAMNNRYPLGLLAVLALTAGVARGQSSSDHATMQALLSEVQQLRLAMEKSLVVGPRMQLTLQRAILQDQRVARRTAQLDEVRKQIASEAAQQTKVTETIAHLDQEISTEADADRRKQLEDMRSALKTNLAVGPDQQLRARESEILSALQVEQGALDDLNAKLDAIERQMEAAQPR
jgi:hypothetical protein